MASASEYSMLFKLSAQLGKEFKSTFSTADNTMTATQQKINQLNRQQADISSYQKQQQAVENTARKLSDLQQEYDNIQREIQETEGYSSALENKLIEKQRAIDKTSASLYNQTDKLREMEKELKDAGVDTDNLSGESKMLADEMDKLAESQKKATDQSKEFGAEGTSAIEAIGSALIAAGIEKKLSDIFNSMVQCSDEAGVYADNILTLSAQYGISTYDLQAFQYAAELADVSVETLTSSMTKNIRSMQSARDGSEKYAEAYDTLGVAVTDSNGKLRDSNAVYWEVIDALGSITNETERDAIAMQLLGRNAMELNTLIKTGSSTMSEYASEAQKTGYILSDDLLKQLGALDDAEQRLKNTQTALKNEIGAQLSPALLQWKKYQAEILSGALDFIKANPGVVRGISAVLVVLLTLTKAYLAYKAIKVAMIAYRKIHNALQSESITLTESEAVAKTGEAAATEGATFAQMALNAAMYACPILAIVGGIGMLIGMMTSFSDSVDSSTSSLEEYNSLLSDVSSFDLDISLSDEELDSARVDGLIESLEQLTQTDWNATKNAGKVQAIVDMLNDNIEGLGLSFDPITGKLNKTITYIKEINKQTTQSNSYNRYAELVAKEAQLVAEKERIDSEYEDLKEKFDALPDINNFSAEDQAVWDAYFEMQKKRIDKQSELLDVRNEISQFDIDNSDWEAMAPTENLLERLEDLKEAYEEAYKSAYDSITKQYQLWDEAAIVSAKSASVVNSNLETQIAYWSDYNKDIDVLLGKADDIEGLSDMIATFADGSPESVNMIAGLAEATDDEIAEMVKKWKTLKEQQEETAKNLGDLKTNFQNELDDYQKMINDSVEKMALVDEAKDAAKQTVDSYIKSLKENESGIFDWVSYIKQTIFSGFEDTHAWIRSGGGGIYTAPSGYTTMIPAHAAGTDNASPGLALVGEKGPELVMFNGGESVFNADETQSYLRALTGNASRLEAIAGFGDRQIVITVSPSFTIEGDDSSLESRIRHFSDELKSEIFDALDEAGIDAKRGVYA